jgi:hypothetical protein
MNSIDICVCELNFHKQSKNFDLGNDNLVALISKCILKFKLTKSKYELFNL